MKNIKIKLVAIAKDEASYISDWVYHHLYFGFDAIEIYINRTNDNSIDVLNEIVKKCPQVSWDSADWVDKCPGNASKEIQFVVYNKVWHETIKSGEYTHIFFLDIDEFWMHQSFKVTIQEYIAQFSRNDVISFEWMYDLGDLNAFSSLPKKVSGNMSPLVKTLYPLTTPIKELRHHVAQFNGTVNHILANKQPFKPKPNLIQAVSSELCGLKDSFIYHRANRSMFEYVSLLCRGRPGDDFPYKSNRFGLIGRTSDYSEFTIPEIEYKHYIEGLVEFRSLVKFSTFFEEAKAFVEKRYTTAIDNMPKYVDANYPLMMQIFKGITTPDVISVFTNFRKQRVKASPYNTNMLRDFAINAEYQDLDEAIMLMEKAQKLRPDGPNINKKLKEFRCKKENMK